MLATTLSSSAGSGFAGKGSGVEVEQPHGWLLEFKDGKVFRFRHFARPQEAVEAAGLSE